jgi:hypothetical protein
MHLENSPTEVGRQRALGSHSEGALAGSRSDGASVDAHKYAPPGQSCPPGSCHRRLLLAGPVKGATGPEAHEKHTALSIKASSWKSPC